MYISHNDDDETVLVMLETPPIHTANIIPSFLPSSFLSFPVLIPRLTRQTPNSPNSPILSPHLFPFTPFTFLLLLLFPSPGHLLTPKRAQRRTATTTATPMAMVEAPAETAVVAGGSG